MTSSFWGGFAESLYDQRVAQDKADREDASLEKRMRKQKELDLEFETTDVEDVDAAGKPVIKKVNSKGDVIGQRYLTQAEVEKRLNDKRKLLAEIEGSEARTAVDKKQAATFDEDRKFKLEDRAADNRRADAQLGVQYAQLAQSERSASRADAREDRIAKQYEDANSAAAYARGELEKVAGKLAEVGAPPANRTRAMATIQGTVNAIIASKEPENIKKDKIARVITAAISQLSTPVMQRPAVINATKGLDSNGL